MLSGGKAVVERTDGRAHHAGRLLTRPHRLEAVGASHRGVRFLVRVCVSPRWAHRRRQHPAANRACASVEMLPLGGRRRDAAVGRLTHDYVTVTDLAPTLASWVRALAARIVPRHSAVEHQLPQHVRRLTSPVMAAIKLSAENVPRDRARRVRHTHIKAACVIPRVSGRSPAGPIQASAHAVLFARG